MFVQQKTSKLLLIMIGVLCTSVFLAGGIANAQKVELRFWHHWGGARVPLMEEQLRRFEAKYPNIEVKATLHPWERRIAKLLTAIAGGNPPDVCMFDRENIPSFVLKGVLVSLDEYMKKDNIDPGMFYEGEYKFCVYQGKTWVLPMPTASQHSLYWNKDMFRDAGIDPDEAPQTWKELEEVSKKFTVIEEGKLKKGGINIAGVGEDFGNLFLSWLHSNNGVGKYLSPDGRKVLLNCPEAIDTFKWMVRFMDEICGGYEKMSNFYAMAGEFGATPFLNNTQAMDIIGPWGFFYIKEYVPEMDFGVALLPHAEGAETHTAVGPGSLGYVIPKGVEHPYESWLLLKWLTCEEEGAGWFVLKQVRPSPIKKFNENPKYRELNPYWDVFVEQLEKDVAIPQSIFTWASGRDTLIDMVEMALYHKKTPEEAIKWAAEETQRLADEALVEYGLK